MTAVLADDTNVEGDWFWLGELEVEMEGKCYSICGGNSEELSESLLVDTLPVRWHGYTPYVSGNVNLSIRLKFQSGMEEPPQYFHGSILEGEKTELLIAGEMEFEHAPFRISPMVKGDFQEIPSFRPPEGKTSCFVTGLGFLVRSEAGEWEFIPPDGDSVTLPQWPFRLNEGTLVNSNHALCRGYGDDGDALFLIEINSWSLKWEHECALLHYPWERVVCANQILTLPVSSSRQAIIDLSSPNLEAIFIDGKDRQVDSICIRDFGEVCMVGPEQVCFYRKNGGLLSEMALPPERETWFGAAGKAMFFRIEPLNINGAEGASKLQWFDFDKMECGEKYLPVFGGGSKPIALGDGKIILAGSRVLYFYLGGGDVVDGGPSGSSHFPMYIDPSENHLDFYFSRHAGPFRRRLLL